MLSLGSGCRNVSSAIVSSVIREIEIWRVAVLMVNRYADEAEANSFLRAEELAAKAITLGRRSGVGPRSPLSSLSTRRDRETDNAPI
jgi:hypothetical protein